MQLLTSQSASALYVPSGERTLARIGNALRVAFREGVALWRQRLEDRRGRVPDAFLNMNVRMLNDVGAPSWLIDRAAAECRERQSVTRSLGWPPMV